ncbi:MAG: flagellar basal body-associated FliL family protein, partial [Thermodesulfobacteriota bacterium]|nr:flagellar basal body-associated FliL family protein [Thermodesulfobacteriota bacterium]
PKVLIITGVSLLVLIALVFAGWFFFLKGNNSDKEAVVTASMEQAEKEEIVEKKEPVFMDIIELEPFENIKLKKSGNMGFLAMNISLELALPVMREEVEADLFRIREVIEQETGKLTWLILRVPQGKLKLKYTLIKSINSLLSEAMISNVYFTRLIMK